MVPRHILEQMNAPQTLLNFKDLSICNSEIDRNKMYFVHNLDTSIFEDIDHYALCLYLLHHKSKGSRGGIFRAKQMTDSQIDTRLWQAMLRGALD